MEKLFKNHSRYRRQIRLTEEKIPCDVFSVRRATRPDDPHYPTTYQDPQIGAYIIIKEAGPASIVVYDIRDQYNRRKLNADEVVEFIKDFPKILLEWLYDINSLHHSNFLPAGYGWDGKFSKIEYSKRQVASLLFVPPHAKSSNLEQAWLNNVLDEICRTSKDMLTLRWYKAKPMPSNRHLAFTNSILDRDVIFIDHSGNIELQKRKKIIGAVDRHPGQAIPEHVHKVILLTYGVMVTDNGKQVGVRIELFSEEIGS